MLLNSIITSYNITEGGSVTWTDLEGIGVGGCTPPHPGQRILSINIYNGIISPSLNPAKIFQFIFR